MMVFQGIKKLGQQATLNETFESQICLKTIMNKNKTSGKAGYQ